MVTPQTVAKPRVFISSTIYDFADLTDALKFWLEEMGFDVQLSERTDFERPPEANAFEACFRSIRQSEYYILLIGKRRGGWYKETDRVSVTRREYRCALESFENSGKPRMVTAVRADVLTVLRERQALGLPEGTSTLEDWQFTDEFIREVRREEEGAAAMETGGSHPPGNWLSSFRDFRELVSILRSTLAIAGPLPRVALLEAVRRDCEHNLRMLLSNHKGQPFYQHWWLDRLRTEVALKPDDLKGTHSTVSLTHDQMQAAVGFLVGGVPSPDVFVRTALDEAVTSGLLLDYDRTTQRFTPSPILTAIYSLRAELDVYSRRLSFQEQLQNDIGAAWGLAKGTRSSTRIPAFTLFMLYALHDTIQNISRLLMGMLRNIYGHTDQVEAQLRPPSPIPEFVEGIRQQTVNAEQLEKWLGDDNWHLRLNLRDESAEQRQQREAIEQRLREALGDDEYEKLIAKATDILSQRLEDLHQIEGSGRP